MVPLRRLLKHKTLAPLLAQAASLLGPGWRIEISEAQGAATPDAAAIHAFPLHIDAVPVGFLHLIAPASTSQSAPSLPVDKAGPLLVTCLESLLAGEFLRRSLASEVLLKYRELSLLHRATVSLNQSLRPRDVALALLAESQRDDSPAEVGMIFLQSPDGGPSLPVAAFGPSEACDLAAVAHSTLFSDIVKTRKGEIINDLGSDQRWRNEAPLQSLLLSPLVAAGRCVGMWWSSASRP